MSLDPVLHALATHWASVEERLAPADLQRLRALVARFTATGASADEQLDAALELTEELSDALPVDHPVRLAIADAGGSRFQQESSPRQRSLLTEELRRLMRTSPSPEDTLSDAIARLLSVPAQSAEELRGRGVDPDQPHLIRLDGCDGCDGCDDHQGPRLPDFQFDAQGRPLSLVLAVNALLDADADPWGVADWWLGRSAWLERSPAESLGAVPDDVLLALARALVEGD